MSRHRNIRSMNYSEEYEGFDDVYGHSVEDDYCVSPSVAEQFIYDRNKRQQMSAFLGPEEEIAEEDEDEDMEKGAAQEHNKTNRKVLNLTDIDQARLQSCLEEVGNVIGDSVSEQTLIDAALSCDFNFEKVLNLVLNNATEKDKSGALKPVKGDARKDKDDCSSCNSSSSPNDRNETQISLPSCNSKVSGDKEKGNSEASSVNLSSYEANNPVSSSVMVMKTKVVMKSESSVHDDSLTSGSEMECSVPPQLHSNVKPQKMEVDADENINVDRVLINKTSGPGTVLKPDSDIGEAQGSINPQLSSDSEEDEFSSLCSLVIHNRRSLSESAGFEQSSPARVPSLPSFKKGMGDNSTSVKPIVLTKEFSQAESGSEEDDYSSLHSLVVHNRSGSADHKDSSNPGPSLFVPALSPARENPEVYSTQNKVAGPSNQMFDDSDSEDFNFSSLCSLVVHNRSHSSDDGAKVPAKESLTNFPNLPDKVQFPTSPVLSGKGPLLNVPMLSTKNAVRNKVESNLPGFSSKPGDDSDSDSEEDFSSLCSLVIHNRSSSSVADTKPTKEGSPPVRSLSKDVEKEKESNLGLKKFVIPPLKLPVNLVKSNETLVEESGSNSSPNLRKVEEDNFEKSILSISADSSNHCSEDEDYVIDLCSTVKAMEINKESSFEEDVDEVQTAEEIPLQLFVSDKVCLLSLSEYDVGVPSGGLQSVDNHSVKLSPFGQTLCRRWDCLARIDSPQCLEDDSGNSDVVAFMFETESPDDICRRARSTKYLIKMETPNVVM